MKIQPAIGLVALQIALLALPVRRPSDVAAAQNPLASLENAAREKAAEEALTKVLNDNLPLTLNAKDVYPTVTTLPGGPFSPKPLQLTADQLDQPLSPGDYTINTLDFCSQYSVHQPGAGLAYVLGPYEGKAAGAIGALIWRGTEQYNINPNSLQAVSWAIQSGLTYDQMPQSYQAIVDQVIPDLKSEITGDYVTNLENTYNSLAKTASLPPLDTILAKLGAPGQLALDAERQRQILTSQNTSDELKQQTLFQGQESGIYTPVKVENGPWTERVAGQVYMKLLIAGGNMTTTNVMQIRVMPPPATTARNAGGNTKGAPHLVRAAFREPQITAVPVLAAAITVAYLMEGIIGYPQGQGAQALGQVAVAAPSAPQAPPAPPSLAQAPPAPPAPVPVAPAPAPPATPDTPAPAPTVAANSGNTANPTIKSHFFFASCSGAITSQQLYSAYNSLYSNSPTFKNDMDSIPDQVQVNNTNYNVAVNVLVVDGCSSSPYLGTFYQNLAGFGNSQIMETHRGAGCSLARSVTTLLPTCPSTQKPIRSLGRSRS